MSDETQVNNPGPEQIAALDFEDALAMLEAEVDRLERGRLRLKDALASYQLIQALSDHCQKLLDEAALQVSVLTANSVTVHEQSAIYRVDALSGDVRQLSLRASVGSNTEAGYEADVDDEDDEDEDDEDNDATEEAGR